MPALTGRVGQSKLQLTARAQAKQDQTTCRRAVRGLREASCWPEGAEGSLTPATSLLFLGLLRAACV